MVETFAVIITILINRFMVDDNRHQNGLKRVKRARVVIFLGDVEDDDQNGLKRVKRVVIFLGGTHLLVQLQLPKPGK